MAKKRVQKVLLEYQPLIPAPPESQKKLRERCTASDDITVSSWRQTWVDNIKANKERFGSFADHGCGKFFHAYRYQPVIVAGSGPSLRVNAAKLKDRKGMCLVSCLHNFHYFEDLDLAPEFYVSLDAGKDITTEEVTEGGTKDEEWYWERTADRKLIAYIGTSPKLLEKWRGEIYFFNAPLPDRELIEEIDQIEVFNSTLSTGGNVLGACAYFAKGCLGCSTLIYVGADFSFGYPQFDENDEPKQKFHCWDSKYDKEMGQTQRCVDVYGNKVHTWPSYYGFKAFFEWMATQVPGEYINATEGGILGSYPQGNIAQFKYMDLDDVFARFHMSYEMERCFTDPSCDEKRILY